MEIKGGVTVSEDMFSIKTLQLLGNIGKSVSDVTPKNFIILSTLLLLVCVHLA